MTHDMIMIMILITLTDDNDDHENHDNYDDLQVIGHPCCIGIRGQCQITTKEFCDFVQGVFHDEAALCSQVLLMLIIMILMLICRSSMRTPHALC